MHHLTLLAENQNDFLSKTRDLADPCQTFTSHTVSPASYPLPLSKSPYLLALVRVL